MNILEGILTILLVTWLISFMVVATYVNQRKEPPKIIETYSTIGFWAMVLGIVVKWLV